MMMGIMLDMQRCNPNYKESVRNPINMAMTPELPLRRQGQLLRIPKLEKLLQGQQLLKNSLLLSM